MDFFVSAEQIGDLKPGAVFVLQLYHLDLLASWGMNDKTRRRYSRLAKVPYKAISELIKARRAYEASHAAQQKIDTARRYCQKHGYSMHKR